MVCLNLRLQKERLLPVQRLRRFQRDLQCIFVLHQLFECLWCLDHHLLPWMYWRLHHDFVCLYFFLHHERLLPVYLLFVFHLAFQCILVRHQFLECTCFIFQSPLLINSWVLQYPLVCPYFFLHQPLLPRAEVLRLANFLRRRLYRRLRW